MASPKILKKHNPDLAAF